MTIFYLNSELTSGHEFMFERIFENFKSSKVLIQKLKLGNFIKFVNNDIIVSAGSPRQNLFFIFFISFISKRVFVYTPFGFDLQFFGINHGYLKNRLYKLFLFKQNISFITCSVEQSEYLKSRFKGKPIYVIRNYNINNTLHNKSSSNKLKPKIFFVGRIEDLQKNVSFFVNLRPHVSNEIILIGNCTSKFLLDLFNLNNIKVFNAKDNPYSYIEKGDLIILPSNYEGAALVVIESCYLGIPIFLKDSVGNRKITNNPILFENLEVLLDLINSYENFDSILFNRIKSFQKEVINEYNEINFKADVEYFEKIVINKL
jgi:hypothetical protein